MIQHITRVVPPAQLEACVNFYALLGFREVSAPAGLAGTARWLELDPAHQPGHPTQLHLLPKADAVPEQGHLAIVASSYGPTLAALEGGGHAPEARTPYWGAQRSFIRDPAGNVVELMESAPQ
jgi:catechol 2,3-dioxygenase-like lactoylglutathione lyase family enzyme